MLRTALAAAVVSVGLFAGGVAMAWTDPAGRVNFDPPRGWTVQPQNATQITYVITATGAAECHVVAQPNGFDDRTPQSIIDASNDDARFDAATWTRIANGLFAPVFRDNSANVVSTAKDASGFWPIQTAQIEGPDGVAHVTMQSRPGVDILSACLTFNGAPPTATFNALILSISHPNDEQWEAMPPEAAPAAAAPAQ
jgi:hypothetical protein